MTLRASGTQSQMQSLVNWLADQGVECAFEQDRSGTWHVRTRKKGDRDNSTTIPSVFSFTGI